MSQHYLLFVLSISICAPVFGAQRFKTLVAPITQAGNLSSPFSITLNQNEKLVIDIESPFSWHRCPREFPRVSCNASICLPAQSTQSSFCHHKTPNHPPKPPCTCFTLPSNPFSQTCASSQLTFTNISINSTNNGHKTVSRVNFSKIFMSCAPKSFFPSLPRDSSGIASLSKGSLSLVSQFSKSNIPKRFGLCLGDQGVIFFGEGLYYFTKFVSYTPLLNHPKDTLGYYIGIKGISINSQAVEFNSLGNGEVKLSTITPYTTLRSHIYRKLLKKFAMATNKIRRAPKYAPFDYCLNTTNLGYSRVGLPVPQIDLELSNGANWTVFGANSMIQVIEDVACFAFVDGGQKAREAIVIGSYQMQHNFLLFDLVKSRLGFSSSLLFFRASCNSFNFT